MTHDPMPTPPPDGDWTADKAKALEAELLRPVALHGHREQIDVPPVLLQRAANMIQTQRLLLECGVDVSVDEDGCCVTCGADALWHGKEASDG